MSAARGTWLLVAVLSLAACSDRAGNDNTQQQVDRAVDKTRETTVAAAHTAAELADKARDKTKAYLDSPEVKQDMAAAGQAIKNVGNSLKGTTEDAAITASVSAAIARDPDLSARRIDVQTQAGIVRLSGPAPTTEAKARAETLAKAVKGVASVDNQLAVTATN